MASWKSPTSKAILAVMLLLLFTAPSEIEAIRVVRVHRPKRVFDDEECKLYGRVFKSIEEIVVGGHENSWTSPPSIDFLDQWSNKTNFAVGDFLIFKYDGKNDSVLRVNEFEYEACNTEQPMQEYKDGTTKIELSRQGHFYFISGAEGRCEKGQKVHVLAIFDFILYWGWRHEMNQKFTFYNKKESYGY